MNRILQRDEFYIIAIKKVLDIKSTDFIATYDGNFAPTCSKLLLWKRSFSLLLYNNNV
jgi:hypothetical protein